MIRVKQLILLAALVIGGIMPVSVQAQSIKKEVQGNRTIYVKTDYTAHAVNTGHQQLVTKKPVNLAEMANGHVDEQHHLPVPKNTVLTVKDTLTNHPGYVVTLAGNRNQFAIINPSQSVYSTKGSRNTTQKTKELKAAGKKWAKGLSHSQVKAIRYYTNNGYHQINTALREPNKKASAKVNASIKAINASLQSFKLTQPVTIYRGISKEGLAKSLGGKTLRLGRQYQDPAYSSCTLSQMTALGFSPQHVVLKINLPVGYHGAYIDPVSTNVGEKEYLLASHTKLIVTKIQNAKSIVHTVTTTKQKGKKPQRQVSNVKTNYRLVTLNLKQ